MKHRHKYTAWMIFAGALPVAGALAFAFDAPFDAAPGNGWGVVVLAYWLGWVVSNRLENCWGQACAERCLENLPRERLEALRRELGEREDKR